MTDVSFNILEDVGETIAVNWIGKQKEMEGVGVGGGGYVPIL